MTRRTIVIGSLAANTATDNRVEAYEKINSNFEELYAGAGAPGESLPLAGGTLTGPLVIEDPSGAPVIIRDDDAAEVTLQVGGGNYPQINFVGHMGTIADPEATPQGQYVGYFGFYGLKTNLSFSTGCFLGCVVNQVVGGDPKLDFEFYMNSLSTVSIRFSWDGGVVLGETTGGTLGYGSINVALLGVKGVKQNFAYTVATLPAAATCAYSRAFVSDSTVTHTAGVGAIVAGGGSNTVPVYSDGTDWRIGG